MSLNRIMFVALLTMVTIILLWAAAIGGAIYTAIHVLAKFW